jgi:hypothetical protein
MRLPPAWLGFGCLGLGLRFRGWNLGRRRGDLGARAGGCEGERVKMKGVARKRDDVPHVVGGQEEIDVVAKGLGSRVQGLGVTSHIL